MRYYLLLSVFVLSIWTCANDSKPVENKGESSKDVVAQEEVVEVQDTFTPDAVSDYNATPVVDPITLPFDYDTTQWTDVGLIEPTIVMDLKYATEDNFVETKMYDCARCFLRPLVAERIIDIHYHLREKGYGLKMFDCYRPGPIQWALWEKVPDPRYVADPRKGSMHNRGGAVDLTLVDSEGNELDMGTPFDFFGRRAYHEYQDHTKEVLSNRKLLKETMEAFGFKAIRTEWWHYSYVAKSYALDDMVWECE